MNEDGHCGCAAPAVVRWLNGFNVEDNTNTWLNILWLKSVSPAEDLEPGALAMAIHKCIVCATHTALPSLFRFENNPRTKSEATWRWNSDYHGSRWIVDAVGAVCKNLKHLESRMLPWTSWKIPIAMRCWPTKRYHTVYTWIPIKFRSEWPKIQQKTHDAWIRLYLWWKSSASVIRKHTQIHFVMIKWIFFLYTVRAWQWHFT